MKCLSGLDSQAILEAATINSARALRLGTRLGTIEEGKQANLVLFSGNPIDDISIIGSPVMVVKNGVLLDQHDLASIRDKAKEVAGWWVSSGRYLDAFCSSIKIL